MKRFWLILFSFLGCHSVDRVTYKPGINVNFSEEPAGQILNIQKAGDFTLFYNNGCENSGATAAKVQFDARIKANFEFVETLNTVDDLGHHQTAKYSRQVISLLPTEMSILWKFLNAYEMGFPTGHQYSEICTFGDASGLTDQYSCHFRTELKKIAFRQCQIVNKKHQSEEEVMGEFALASNKERPIPVRKKDQSIDGVVYCDGQSLGEGRYTQTRIYSNDIPALDGMFCGGTKIFDLRVFKVGSKLIYGSKKELLEAPIVP